MKGTTLLRLNHDTLVEAIQLYLDTKILQAGHGQVVERVMHGPEGSGDTHRVSYGDVVTSCVVALTAAPEPAPEGGGTS